MLLLTLVGCGIGSFTLADGDDRVRTALYFEPDSSLSLERYGARQGYVLLANSTLPCWPVDEDGDPGTAPSDTDQRYWDAQKLTLLSREGALFVAFALAIAPDEDWLGRYPVQSDAWDSNVMSDYAADDGRVASGAWWEVLESAVDGTGLDYALDGGVEVVEEAHDFAVGAPAWVEIARKDTAVTGTFDLAPTEISGTFRAERCDNLDLLAFYYQVLAQLALADGALDEGDDTGVTVPPASE